MRNTGFRILSIDPGTTCFGWAVSNYHRDTNKFQVMKFGNIRPSDTAKKQKDECNLFTKQIVSFVLIENLLHEIMDTYHPQYIVTEDAFYQPPRINAFIILRLCIHTIARICKDYNLGLYKLPPCEVKKLMAGSGHADKLTIQESILKNDNITFKGAKQVSYDKIIEHEADAIAVGWAFSQKILGG